MLTFKRSVLKNIGRISFVRRSLKNSYKLFHGYIYYGFINSVEFRHPNIWALNIWLKPNYYSRANKNISVLIWDNIRYLRAI